MWDSSNGVDRRRRRRPSTNQLLGTCQVLSLALAGYLFWHPEIRASQFLSTVEQAQAAATILPATPGNQVGSVRAVSDTVPISASTATNLRPSVVAPTASPTTPDLDVMVQQLETMQSSLRLASGQLEDPSALIGPAPVSASPALAGPATGSDAAAILVEIEQLYQVMRPLMQQIQVAVQSSRPESELVAMRAQMEDLHRRLAVLMARVQVAKANPVAIPVVGPRLFTPAAPATTKSNGSPIELDPNKAMYEQMQQMQQILSQIERILEQMQNAATPNAPWIPGPGQAPFSMFVPRSSAANNMVNGMSMTPAKSVD